VPDVPGPCLQLVQALEEHPGLGVLSPAQCGEPVVVLAATQQCGDEEAEGAVAVGQGELAACGVAAGPGAQAVDQVRSLHEGVDGPVGVTAVQQDVAEEGQIRSHPIGARDAGPVDGHRPARQLESTGQVPGPQPVRCESGERGRCRRGRRRHVLVDGGRLSEQRQGTVVLPAAGQDPREVHQVRGHRGRPGYGRPVDGQGPGHLALGLLQVSQGSQGGAEVVVHRRSGHRVRRLGEVDPQGSPVVPHGPTQVPQVVVDEPEVVQGRRGARTIGVDRLMHGQRSPVGTQRTVQITHRVPHRSERAQAGGVPG
jgi:hypothetical protein